MYVIDNRFWFMYVRFDGFVMIIMNFLFYNFLFRLFGIKVVFLKFFSFSLRFDF